MQTYEILNSRLKESYGNKHVGTKFPMCPCCTVLRLRLVPLRFSYFTNFIPFAWHDQFFANNHLYFFRKRKTFTKI